MSARDMRLANEAAVVSGAIQIYTSLADGRLASFQSGIRGLACGRARKVGSPSGVLESDPAPRQPKQWTLTRRAPAAWRKRGRPVDLSSKRQLKLAMSPREVRSLARGGSGSAGSALSGRAAGATGAAQRSEIMRLHREARLRAMLAPLTEEQHAEAEQLFWERA
jgi:hypothetical protein